MLIFLACSLPPDGFNPSNPAWNCVDGEVICLDGAIEEINEYGNLVCSWDCAEWDDGIYKVDIQLKSSCPTYIVTEVYYDDWCNPYDFQY
jgi:hypothetical protein